LELHVYEREPEITIQSIDEIQRKLNQKVSTEGIFNLHTSVETMEEKFSAKINSLENIINQISKKDENFEKVVQENEVLKHKNEMLEQYCKNLEYRVLSMEN
jgi:phage-related protein